MTVPLYGYDQEFQGYIPERYAHKLERDGVAKLVRHKKGKIARVVLHRRAGDPQPPTLRAYTGQPYSFQHHLDDGHRPWALKPLGSKVNRQDRKRPAEAVLI